MMKIVLVWVLAWLGFVFLAAGMNRHFRQIAGSAECDAVCPWLRGCGWGLLAASFLLREHFTAMVDLTVWLLMLTPLALSVVLILAYAPSWFWYCGVGAVMQRVQRRRQP
jgi:hypothetical protein